MIKQIYIFFRLFSLVFALLGGVFSYLIYKLTKGGSKGWKYLAIGAISISLWGLSQLVFIIINIQVIRVALSALFKFIFGVFILLGSIKLVEDMGIKKLNWLNTRNAIIYSFFVYFIFLIYNLLIPYENILIEMDTITMVTNVFCLFPTSLNFYRLWKGTEIKKYAFLFLGSLGGFLGESLIPYIASACENISSYICTINPYEHAPVIPVMYIQPLVEFALYADAVLLFAESFFFLGFLLLWKVMKK